MYLYFNYLGSLWLDFLIESNMSSMIKNKVEYNNEQG